jgi:hypothetical protein
MAATTLSTLFQAESSSGPEVILAWAILLSSITDILT